MRRFLFSVLILAAPAAFALPAEGASGGVEEADATNVTVITAASMVYDHGRKVCEFEGNVRVTDAGAVIVADRMTVEFGRDGAVGSIEAEGNVRIEQEDRLATCATAVCSVAEGKMVLTGDPRIRRGEEIVKGDVITIYRDPPRIVCVPGYLKLRRDSKLGDISLPIDGGPAGGKGE